MQVVEHRSGGLSDPEVLHQRSAATAGQAVGDERGPLRTLLGRHGEPRERPHGGHAGQHPREAVDQIGVGGGTPRHQHFVRRRCRAAEEMDRLGRALQVGLDRVEPAAGTALCDRLDPAPEEKKEEGAKEGDKKDGEKDGDKKDEKKSEKKKAE